MQHPTHKSIWSSIFYWHRHDLRSASSAQQLQHYSRDLCPILHQAHLSAHLFTCASVHEWYKDISAEVYFEAGSAGVYSCLVKSYIYWGQVLQPLTAGQKKKKRKKKACAACFFSFVCDREGVTGVCGTGRISMCECVLASTYECVSEFSDLSVERLHVCLLWALWLKEHGATYLAVMCCREMPLMSATRCSTKGKAGTHVLKTQLLKSTSPSDHTNSKRMCVCVRVCCSIRTCTEGECPCVSHTRTCDTNHLPVCSNFHHPNITRDV